jgi:hypothetical protein
MCAYFTLWPDYLIPSRFLHHKTQWRIFMKIQMATFSQISGITTAMGQSLHCLPTSWPATADYWRWPLQGLLSDAISEVLASAPLRWWSVLEYCLHTPSFTLIIPVHAPHYLRHLLLWDKSLPIWWPGGDQGQYNNLHMTKLHAAQHGHLGLHSRSVLKHVYRCSLSTLASRINLDYMHEDQALSSGKLSFVDTSLLPNFRQSLSHLSILNLRTSPK